MSFSPSIPRIKMFNMKVFAESAESQLLIKIQGLNNFMFGKLINIFSVVCLLFLGGGVVNKA